MPSKTETAGAESSSFRVDDWLIESSLNRLTRGSEVVRLEPNTMKLLVFLSQHAGTVVSRQLRKDLRARLVPLADDTLATPLCCPTCAP